MGVNRRTINRKVIYIMNGAVCYYLIGSQKVCSVGRAVGDLAILGCYSTHEAGFRYSSQPNGRLPVLQRG